MSNVVTMPRPAAVPPQIGCSMCGATTDAACDCGAPYVPAGQRAAEAIAANPTRSDRAIAAEIGVDHKTVGAARRSGGECSPTDKRVGQDGKSYPATKVKAVPSAQEERDREEVVALYQKAIEAERERDQWLSDHPGHSDDDGDDPGDTDEEIATRGFMYRASESASMAHYPLKDLVVTDEIIRFAVDAAESWSQLVEKIKQPQVKQSPAVPGNGLTLTLDEGWREPFAHTEEYLGVPAAEYLDFIARLGQDAFNRKFQSGLTGQIKTWLVDMHEKYPDTFNTGSWEGSCGHLSIDNLRAAQTWRKQQTT